MFHTYTPQRMPLLSLNFLQVTVSEIQPEKDFNGQGHHGKVKDQMKVTP